MNWYDLLPQEIFGEEKKSSQIGGIGTPVAMVQTTNGAKTIHQGEATVQNPNGTVSVIPQEQLKQMEKSQGIGGYAAGGTFTPVDPLATDTTLTAATQAGNLVGTGIGVIEQVATGKLQPTGAQANSLNSQFGGAAQAGIGAAKQEAAQAGYSKAGIGSVAQTAQRNVEGERSKLAGTLAVNAQNNQIGAAQTLVTTAGNERTYQNTQRDEEWDRDLLNYDPANPEELKFLQDTYQRLYGTPAPSLAVLTERRNNAKILDANTVKTSNLNVTDLQNRVDGGLYSSLTQRITNGATFDEINATNPGVMTLSEYNNIYRKGQIDLSTREYGLTTLKTNTDSNTWNAAVQKILANPNMTLAEAQKLLPGIAQSDLNGILHDYKDNQNEKLWEDAVLYNDASTPKGIAKLQEIYMQTHPGADVPDLAQLARIATDNKNTLNERMTATATKTSENIIADLAQGLTPLTDASVYGSDAYKTALTNKNLRASVATKLGLTGGDSVGNAGAIETEIRKMLVSSSQGDIGTIMDGFQSYIPSKDLDNPALQGQLRTALQHLLVSGGLTKNADGTFTVNEAVELPWNAPATHFEYTDWNGNDIVYDDKGIKPANYAATVVQVGGANAKKTVDGVESDLTFKDMDAKWSTMGPSDQQRYFTNGAFDNKKFITENFGTGKSADGTGSVTLNADDISKHFMSPGNTDLTTIYSNMAGDATTGSTVFESSGVYPGIVGKDPNAGEPLPATDYQYYDENGVLQHESKTNGNLSNIWLQFSQMYTPGRIMTSQEFQNKWKDGKGWAITSDGIVANFNPDYQKENSLNATNPVYSNGTPVKFEYTPGTTKLDVTQATGILNRWEDLVAAKDERITSIAYKPVGENSATNKANDAAEKYSTDNKGKIMNYNGSLYEVTGRTFVRGVWAYIQVRDVVTGNLMSIDPGNGSVVTSRGYNRGGDATTTSTTVTRSTSPTSSW